MQSFSKKALWLIITLVSAVPLAMGATISGTVKGPDGTPFEGAFVEAQNTATNISTDVLSQVNGSYLVPNLPTGTYRLTIRAVGYKAAPQSETIQTADQNAKADFSMEKGTVQWSDLSVWQAQLLLPNGPGRKYFFGPREQPFGAGSGTLGLQQTCFTCHDFQSRMATRRLNHQGWLGLVNFMRFDAVPYFIGKNGVIPFTNQMANQAADYLTQIFGLNSTLPASPADLPAYQSTVRRFSNHAMNIVYVTYPTPDQTWLPFQAYPPTASGFPSDGYIWVGNYGNANEVDRINPTTGKAQAYHVSCPSAAGIHSVEVGPDGYVWFAEQGCNRVGRIDVETGQVKEYQAPYLPGKEWGLMGGSTHDAHPMMVDGKLYVFSSGYPATRLDPRTGKFTPVPGTHDTYDVYQDLVNGKIWLTNIEQDPLREVDPKTLKILVKVAPSVSPKTFQSHRIAISSKGVVWVTCRGDRICSYNPTTKAFHQYTPLGPETNDYAIGIDATGGVWWSMSNLDTLQRLDPKTGKMMEYPFPYPEITMRKFWLDKQGRMWTTSPANGVVVYWYLAKSHMPAAK